jgi:hypothetical protein
MLRRVALERTVSKERRLSFIRVTRIGELATRRKILVELIPPAALDPGLYSASNRN